MKWKRDEMLITSRTILLGLWVGAMAGFAFLFAPVAFTHIGPTSAFAATIAACVDALVMCGVVVAATCAAITATQRERSRRRYALYALLGIATIGNLIERLAVVPAMQKTPLMTPAYESLHRESSGVFSVILLCALIAYALSARATSV